MSRDQQKSAAEAERDVADARADLKGSLEDLERKISPENMIEQAISYFRGDGRRYVDALGREVRSNPIPLALIGIGLAWLAVGSTQRTRIEGDSRRYLRERYDRDRAMENAELARRRNIADRTETAEPHSAEIDRSRPAGRPVKPAIDPDGSDIGRDQPGPTSDIEPGDTIAGTAPSPQSHVSKGSSEATKPSSPSSTNDTVAKSTVG